MWHTYSVEYYSDIRRNQSCHLWHEWTIGYYTKWNKSDRKRQILYDFTYTWNIKNKWTETELKTQKTVGWRRGKERNRWDRWRGTNFQFQNKWVAGMKYTGENIVNNCNIFVCWQRVTRLILVIILKWMEILYHYDVWQELMCYMGQFYFKKKEMLPFVTP